MTKDRHPRTTGSEPREDHTENANTWLNAFAKDVTSQNGEDGIIEKILEVIGRSSGGWCVEFGSWDGRHCSNTFSLIDQRGYSAVLIEGSRKRFKDLLTTFKGNSKVIPICAYVGFGAEDGLDAILAKTEIPKDFDVLSIDIDGNDYHVWQALQGYQPKVVVIETNPTIPPAVRFIQPADPRVTQGSSLLSVAELGRSKGYELVCVAGANAIFVDAEYFPRFGIQDNSVETMMKDQSLITHIFCGFDGTVFLRGCGTMPWQQIPYEEARAQQLPRWARKTVGDRNFLRRKLRKLYLQFRRKNHAPSETA